MILNGFRLLFRLNSNWSSIVDKTDRGKTSFSIAAAAITAAVFPAASVVFGHLGSAALGNETHSTAALRAAVGFAATAGSAMVMAPAMTLIIIMLTESNFGEATTQRASSVSLGIMWPVWTAGFVLGILPLLGLGPEAGEILWALSAFIIAQRIFRTVALPSLNIRRRWATRFSISAAAAFTAMFITTAIAPAMAVRAMLGAATVISHDAPTSEKLPLPSAPDW